MRSKNQYLLIIIKYTEMGKLWKTLLESGELGETICLIKIIVPNNTILGKEDELLIVILIKVELTAGVLEFKISHLFQFELVGQRVLFVYDYLIDNVLVFKESSSNNHSYLFIVF